MISTRFFRRLFFGMFISILLILGIHIYLIKEYRLKESTINSLNYSQNYKILGYFTKINSWFYDLLHFNNIRNQAYDLININNQLLYKLSTLNDVIQENNILKTALRLKEEKKWNLVPAEIIFVDPTGLTGDIWINKGIKDGITKGMNVILDNESIVGVTSECFESYCRVSTILSPQTKISVKHLPSNTIAIVNKDLKGQFILKLVPHDVNIEIGDLVITSNENKQYLSGLIVGQIKQLNSEEVSFKEYVIEPLFSLNQLTRVLIITNFVIPNG